MTITAREEAQKIIETYSRHWIEYFAKSSRERAYRFSKDGSIYSRNPAERKRMFQAAIRERHIADHLDKHLAEEGA